MADKDVQLQIIAKLTDEVSAPLAKAKAAVKELADEQQRLLDQAKQGAGANADGLAKAFGVSAAQYNQLGREIQQTNVPLGTFERLLREVQGGDFSSIHAKVAEPIAEVAEDAEASVESLTSMRTAVLGLAVGAGAVTLLGGALYEASRYALDFNLALIETQLRSDDVATHFDAFKDKLASLSSEYATSATTIAEGASRIVDTTTLRTAEGIARFEDVAARASLLGLGPLNESIDISSKLLNAWRVPLDESNTVLAKTYAASKLGATGFAELATEMTRLGPFATELGVRFDELAVIIPAMNSKGVETAQTVHGLSRFMQQLSDPTSRASKDLENYGIQTDHAAFETRGLLGTIELLQKTIPETKLKELLTDLFGSVRVGAGVLALASSDTQKLRDEMVGLLDSEVTFDRQANEIANNASNRLKRTVQEMKNLALGVGEGGVSVASALFGTSFDLPQPDAERLKSFRDQIVAALKVDDLASATGIADQLTQVAEQAKQKASEVAAAVGEALVNDTDIFGQTHLQKPIDAVQQTLGLTRDQAVGVVKRFLAQVSLTLNEEGVKIANTQEAGQYLVKALTSDSPALRQKVHELLQGAFSSPDVVPKLAFDIDSNGVKAFQNALAALALEANKTEFKQGDQYVRVIGTALDSAGKLQLTLEQVAQTVAQKTPSLAQQLDVDRARATLTKLQLALRGDLEGPLVADLVPEQYRKQFEELSTFLDDVAGGSFRRLTAAEKAADSQLRQFIHSEDELAKKADVAETRTGDSFDNRRAQIDLQLRDLRELAAQREEDSNGLLRNDAIERQIAALQQRRLEIDREQQAQEEQHERVRLDQLDRRRKKTEEFYDRIDRLQDQAAFKADRATELFTARALTDREKFVEDVHRRASEALGREALAYELGAKSADEFADAMFRIDDAAASIVSRADLDHLRDSLLAIERAAASLDRSQFRGLGQIDVELKTKLTGLERDQRAGKVEPQEYERLRTLYQQDAAQQKLDVILPLSAKPRFDFEQAQFQEELRPKIEELAKNTLASLDAISAGSPDAGERRLAELRKLQRGIEDLELSAQRTDERFAAGLRGASVDAVRKFTDYARQGYELAQTAIESFTDHTGAAIKGLLDGTATLRDELRGFLNDVASIISRILAERLIANFLPIGGGGGGSVLHAAGGVFPGGVLGTTGSTASFAEGGIARGRQTAIIGDNASGYEAFVPLPGPGRGIPVEFTVAPQTAAPSVQISVSYEVHAVDARAVKDMLVEHGRTIADVAAAHLERGYSSKLRQSVKGVR